MNNVNKTLYIPLYGKAYVSQKGLFMQDKKAEEIWENEKFKLKGKSKSKWLAYYMGIRSAVIDEWLKKQMTDTPNAVIIHLGCGMDSRVLRVGKNNHKWYDVDFAEVIQERKRYYTQSENYQMLAGDIREDAWLNKIPENQTAIVVMEGVSMYINPGELKGLIERLDTHFQNISLIMDCYTVFAAKMSKLKNPINDVGVRAVYGINQPNMLATDNFHFQRELTMTPKRYIEELKGVEKFIFKKLYAGNFSKKLYKLYEYKKETVK